MNRTAAWFLLLLLACSAPVVAEVGSRAGSPSPDLPAFVERLESLRKDSGIQGLSVAVVQDQAILLALGLGYADVEHGVLASAETPYDIASVAKPLSAVVALRLAEEGTVDLDRPMAEYSAWEAFCTEFSRQPIVFAENLRCAPPVHTLRNLLSHTASGIPGEQFSYNPVLYSWASRPLMAATGEPFSALVEQYVFGPAGMTRSARKHRDLPLRDDIAKRLASPYRRDASGAPERSPTEPPQGDGAAGGVVTTALDLARFDIALDQGKLLSRASRDAMMTPTRSRDGAALPYGLGWFVQEYKGHRLAWHSGWWENAYSALYLKIPDLGVSVILLANGEGVWRGNPLDKAEIQQSPFARAALDTFVDRIARPPVALPRAKRAPGKPGREAAPATWIAK